MIILFDVGKQKTKITMNGFTSEHRTGFLKKLNFNDVLLFAEVENKKIEKAKADLEALSKY